MTKEELLARIDSIEDKLTGFRLVVEELNDESVDKQFQVSIRWFDDWLDDPSSVPSRGQQVEQPIIVKKRGPEIE